MLSVHAYIAIMRAPVKKHHIPKTIKKFINVIITGLSFPTGMIRNYVVYKNRKTLIEIIPDQLVSMVLINIFLYFIS